MLKLWILLHHHPSHHFNFANFKYEPHGFWEHLAVYALIATAAVFACFVILILIKRISCSSEKTSRHPARPDRSSR